MWKHLILYSLPESSLTQSGRSLSCQFRNATSLPVLYPSRRHYCASKSSIDGKKSSAKQPSSSAPTSPANSKIQFKQNPQPTPSQPGDKDFVPPLLNRPIGLVIPPQEGQNTGIDTRTLRQRRDDFVDYSRHLERRKELTRQVAKPYFREWSNLKYHEGKTFKSNPRLFKRDKALFFPNMYGITLASPKLPQNTTSILRGKVSIVSLFSSVWAEAQVATFTGPKQNPGLYEAMKSGSQVQNRLVQKVDINLEENRVKAWLVRMFMWRMRGKLPEEQHQRYFLVRKGLTDGLKEAIGMMNSKVGYVYLLDENCRIRWAGSGPAEEVELAALNNGVRKLIEERRISLESEIPAEQWQERRSDESMPLKPRVAVRP
ncbi:Mitochondrial ATPase complex subunit atp10 [Monascus purpureus]|uniref:Mitochondrial ATPase complex subunit atp10 n=1 Tax=Monascus purpureus TaxID=5098 RepID=A0A507QY80_MONPU|nr:Mitochondrial ATPase complex subunit atp10 [Monascus purpureus]BDD54766.1 hypothetical protein MAP00_000356 [Monascus purpureus]